MTGEAWITGRSGSRPFHLAAVLAAGAIGFAVSFVAVTLLALPRDLFVLVHLLVTGAFLALWAWRAGVTVAEFRARWPLGLALAVAAGAFSVNFVLSQPGSPGPEGATRLFALLWLGLVYGVVDALLLSVLPVCSVWRAARAGRWLDGWAGRAGTAVLALAASATVTVAYHLGFPEFQGAAVWQPVIGNTVFTLAYLLSGSPVAPAVAHVAMHVAAVLHAYGTSVPLPPHY